MSESSSSSKKLNEARCPICNFRLRSCANVDRKLIKSQEEIDKVLRLMNKPVEIGDILCAKCNKKLSKQSSLEKKQLLLVPEPCSSSMLMDNSEHFTSTLSIDDSISTINDDQSQSIMVDPTLEYTQIEKDVIEMPFSRPIISHSCCFICPSTSNLKDIPIEARLQVFLKRRILVPKRNRCCKQHLMNGWLNEDEINNIIIESDKCEIELSDMAKFMDLLASSSLNIKDKINNRLMPQCQLYALTAHSWEDIDHLQSLMTYMKNTNKRSVIQAIVTFLCKLRTGNVNKVIAVFSDILPYRFGYQSITRDFLINERSSPVVKNLLDCQNNLIIICDGTYNLYQKNSYSGNKKTTLCKLFTICTTDGFIIDVPGPYNVNENNSTILNEILNQNNGLSVLLQPGDYFVLDNGFRDVVPILKKCGFNVMIPNLEEKNIEPTNDSRLATKIHWVVKAVHAEIGQKYKLLHNQFENKSLPRIAAYCRIAFFLHNEFGQKFNFDSGNME
ncbi:uncharacterized protein LOC142597294 isoform X2 [Dermatophagoides farinae]|uniref:uncharacterized protein LOC142597294 isoform X2 n=1 Tax=Dermatophagoides farinae TaxID=6954 RepID=UPI003F62171E